MSLQGATLRMRAGVPVAVGKPVAMDGLSVTYSATAGGAAFTVTWYPASPDTDAQAESVASRIDAGRPDPAFLWPIDTAVSEEIPGFGYATPILRPALEPLVNVLSRIESMSFPVLISVGRQLVRAFAALHRSGLCYRDFGLANVLVDAQKAEIALLGFEDIGPDGSAGYVAGITPFTAPEMARDGAPASASTDRHSLAVLLFVVLMRGNPLTESGVQDGGLVLKPVFVFDPEDHSSRPVPGDPVLTWWPIYPRFLRELFEQAFTTGLSDPPSGRVSEGQWRVALARLDECVSTCSCGAAVLADRDDAGQRCWNCDRALEKLPGSRRADNGLMASPPLGARVRRVTRRFAEVICPPGMRAHHRTDRVLAEFELMLGALAPAARRALTAAILVLDQGARLYPRARGRAFTRLDDEVAQAYIRALLARGGVPAQLVQRLRGLVAMCYYELPTVQREIGYHPAPYIAAVSRRRQASYAPDITAAEASVTRREP